MRRYHSQNSKGFLSGAVGQQLNWREESRADGLYLPDMGVEVVLHTDHHLVSSNWLVELIAAAIECITGAGRRLIKEAFEIPGGLLVRLQDPWNNPLVILDSSKGELVGMQRVMSSETMALVLKKPKQAYNLIEFQIWRKYERIRWPN